MKNLKNKNWVRIVFLLIPALVLLLQNFGVEISEGELNQVINFILAILVAAGIISNNDKKDDNDDNRSN